MSLPPLGCQVVLVLLVLVASVYDARFRRIPNWSVVSGLVLGVGLNTLLFEWRGLRYSLLGLGLGFLIYFPLYLLRGMGAGDVKLMAAIGSIVGAANWFGIFVVTALLGGLVAMIALLMRGRLGNSLWNVGFLLQRLSTLQPPYAREELDISSPKSIKLPHGLVIACGCLLFIIGAWTWAPRR